VRLAPPLLLALVLLAACGGSRGPLDADLGEKLARQADAVAAAGDPCAARTHARILQRQAIAATNAGRIPAEVQEVLLSRANELVDELELRCLPTPAKAAAPPPTPQPSFGPGNGKGKDKGKKGRWPWWWHR
jgi:hypothetical protein